MWIQKIIFSFLIAIFLIGCGSPRINLKPNDKLISQSFVVTIPDDGWYTFYTIEERLQRSENGYDILGFSRNIPDKLREVFDIETDFLDSTGSGLFDKNKHKDLEESLEKKKASKERLKNYSERGVSYYKRFIDYMVNLKCMTYVESQNIANGVGTKRYQTSCCYYDKQGLPKSLYLSYWYVFTFGDTTFKDASTPSLRIATMKEIQDEFKQDVKKIVDNIELFDMDKEKMKKEGLYYEDKEYDVNDEFKTKGRVLDCGISKVTNRWECEEKIADY